MKKRFPVKEKRAELRRVFDSNGQIPDEILHSDEYFSNFKLQLPQKLPDMPNKFKGLNYATLGEYKTQFDLRPIRNVIIKQNEPKEDDSSIYEIFNRLNSGGINLRSQEIRTSLYHSKFYEMLYKINVEPEWRRLLRMPEPDLHMKDVEILLRAYALLIDVHNYRPSMTKFVNQFSKKSRMNSNSKNEYLERLFFSFLEACNDLPDDIFINKGNNRFNIALYEAVFAVACKNALQENRMVHGKLSAERLEQLDNDPEFSDAATKATSGTTNVTTRLRRAQAIVGSL